MAVNQVPQQQRDTTAQQHANAWHRFTERVKRVTEEHEERLKLSEIAFKTIDVLLKLHRFVSDTLESVSTKVPAIGTLITGIGQVAMGVSKAIRLRHQTQAATLAQRASVGVKLTAGLGMIAATIVGLAVPPLGAAMAAVVVGLGFGTTLYKTARTAYKLSSVKAKLASLADQDEGQLNNNTQRQQLTQKLQYQRSKARIRRNHIILGAFSLGLAIGVVFAAPVIAAGLMGGMVAMNVGYFGKKSGFISRAGSWLRSALGIKPRPTPQAATQTTTNQHAETITPTPSPKPEMTQTEQPQPQPSKALAEEDEEEEGDSGSGATSLNKVAHDQAAMVNENVLEPKPEPKPKPQPKAAPQPAMQKSQTDFLAHQESCLEQTMTATKTFADRHPQPKVTAERVAEPSIDDIETLTENNEQPTELPNDQQTLGAAPATSVNQQEDDETDGGNGDIETVADSTEVESSMMERP
jgi:hypothetical protein